MGLFTQNSGGKTRVGPVSNWWFHPVLGGLGLEQETVNVVKLFFFDKFNVQESKIVFYLAGIEAMVMDLLNFLLSPPPPPPPCCL